jgi:Rha family phage regulatory protein
MSICKSNDQLLQKIIGGLMPNLQPKIIVQNGHPTTTSNNIADFFERNHRDVTHAINDFLAVADKDFSLRNFTQSTYQNSRGQTYPNFIVTRSGFAAIALAFTGKKALDFRVAYINRFDEMERQLNEKALRQATHQLVKDRYLPFGEPVVRDAVSIGTAITHIRILKRLPELTNGKLKGMLVRGEVEGFQNERGHWRIYDDEITRLLGGSNDEH